MKNALTLSERSLIENCINRNRKSQKELFERLSPKMFPICMRFAKDRIDAEEILQNGFLKLFDKLHKFREDELFEEWVRKIFINAATEYNKRNKITLNMNEDFKMPVTDEYIRPIEGLYENFYTKVSGKYKKTDNGHFKLYALDGYSVPETIEKSRITAKNLAEQPEAEKRSHIRFSVSDRSKNQGVELKYTLQKGDEKRLDKHGVLRLYNVSEALEIPVTQLLGKWTNDNVGVTLVFKHGNWQVTGEMNKHVIQRHRAESRLELKRLFKFV